MSAPAARLRPTTRVALVWGTVLVHGLAIVVMKAFLEGGLLEGDVAARRAFVAGAGLSWSLGWALWSLTTVSLLLTFLVWADTVTSRPLGLAALVLTFLGGVVDWSAEAVWVGWAPSWARQAAADEGAAILFARWDHAYQVLAIGLANGLYATGGILLTVAAWRTAGFPRWLSRLSAVVWGSALAMSVPGLLAQPAATRIVATVSLGLFVPWLLLLAYGWLAGRHPLPEGVTGSLGFGEATSFRETLRRLVPKHPLPMTTVFRQCVLANFAVDPEVMAGLLPHEIAPVLHEGKAFLSVVLADMDKMRPAFFPRLFGVTYHQIVYRVVVRCRGELGVAFLRSDATSPFMATMGDWLTFFRFHHAAIRSRHEGGLLHLDALTEPGGCADVQGTYDLGGATEVMPKTSRFRSLAEAREFLVELFAAFGHDPLTGRVLTVRIQRGRWNLRVVEDRRGRYRWMEGSGPFPPGSASLDSVFYVEAIPYRWHALEGT